MDKVMHVSPFCGMAQQYQVVAGPPGPTLTVRVDAHEAGTTVIETELRLRRREMTPASMSSMLLRHPLMAQRVSAGIYRQALWLWAKGVPYHPHPGCPVPRTPAAGAGGEPAVAAGAAGGTR